MNREDGEARSTAYRDNIGRFIQEALFDNRLTDWSQVTHRHVRGWLVQLTDRGDARATIRRRLTAIKSLWRFLLFEEQVTTNTPEERLRRKAEKLTAERAERQSRAERL